VTVDAQRTRKVGVFAANVEAMRGWVRAAVVASLWALAPAPAGAHPGLSKEIDTLTERLRDTPRDADLRLRRAAVYRRLEHYDDALADVRRVLRAAPDHTEARLERALIRVALKRDKAALDDLDHVLAGEAPPSVAWAARARLHAAAERYEQARHDYDRALEQRAHPDYFLERGRVDEAREAWDDAAAGYREGAERSGAIVLRIALVEVERRRGDTEAAMTEVDALLDSVPHRIDWILLRADLLAEAGRAEAATVERLRALALAHAAVARRNTELSRESLAATYRALERTEPLS